MKGKIAKHLNIVRASLVDDGQRSKVQFISIYLILTVVAAFMTVVNVFTRRHELMLSTLFFAVANLLNLLLSIREGVGRKIASILLSFEIPAVFIFFIISGEPEGFSVIWVCLLPSSGLLLFGKKRGCMLCAFVFAALLFLFYLPFGRTLLQYDYTESFLLRFPMLYVAFFAVAFFLETIREETYLALQDSKRQYQHLYSHDALTGVYNRYGFNEHMDALLKLPHESGIALVILDIDNFKIVNDRYGHPKGDVILKEIAALLVRESGPDALVCRWGGEEFAVILPTAADCGAVAARLLEGIRSIGICVGDETVRVTVSAGLVMSSPHMPVDAAALVTQTDRCLYQAKDAGKNRVVQMPYVGVIGSSARSERMEIR